MTAHDLLTDLHRQGFTLRPLPGGMVEVSPKAKLTNPLRQAIRQHKPEILRALTRPPVQKDLWQTGRAFPLPPPPPPDAEYWTATFNELTDRWQRKDWGPCHECGQNA
jgi:hypothetical protein